jgi:hypothetical protein
VALSRSPGLAGKQDEPTVAAVGSEQGVLELRELVLPADEDGREDSADHSGILTSRALAMPYSLIRITTSYLVTEVR